MVNTAQQINYQHDGRSLRGEGGGYGASLSAATAAVATVLLLLQLLLMMMVAAELAVVVKMALQVLFNTPVAQAPAVASKHQRLTQGAVLCKCALPTS
jgi:hypothetical protein